MNILVDARPIVDTTSGGVSRVARALVAAYAGSYPEDTLTCLTTGWRKPTLPDELRSRPNVIHRHIQIPNKLWSALSTFFPCLPPTAYHLLPRFDAAFFPNLGFIGTMPKTISSTLLLHDLSFLIEPKWFSWKQRLWHRAVRAKKLIRSATHLLAVSETTKRDAIRLLDIPADRIRVIPLGPTLDLKLRATSYEQRASRFILALGGSDPRKNSATAVQAVRALRDEKGFEDVSLVLVGAEPCGCCDGPWLKKIQHPSDEELTSLYQNASAFLYPSWYEGFGLPLHEAAAFGTPCIASTSGALPETAPNGTFFADPAKPQHWTEALKITLLRQRPSSIRQNEDAWERAASDLHEAFLSKA